jgi:organic hydroperoxide reductase OsmC/OhrA
MLDVVAGTRLAPRQVMHPFPHHYSVHAHATPEDDVMLRTPGVAPLRTTTPVEFGGAGELWSPETLFVAAIADCFLLTFRAVAAASRMPWISIECDASGTLDRVERVTQFTSCRVHARLRVPAGTDEAQARRLLEKAETNCLVTNSLKCPTTLDAQVEIAAEGEPAASWHQVD